LLRDVFISNGCPTKLLTKLSMIHGPLNSRIKKELMAAAQKDRNHENDQYLMYCTHCTFRKIKTDVDFIISCYTCWMKYIGEEKSKNLLTYQKGQQKIKNLEKAVKTASCWNDFKNQMRKYLK